jgi:hypothetical protein
VTRWNLRARSALILALIAVPAALAQTGALAQPAQPCTSPERGQVSHGDVVTGRIDECHPEEFWTFEGVRGQAVIISMERPDPPTFAGLDLDPILQLLGPAIGERMPMIAEDDDGGIGVDARIELVLRTTGTYRIVATSFERAAGDYVLRFRVLGMSATDRGAIQPGETVSGTLDAANEEEVWTFEARQGQRVLISLRRARPTSLESIALDPLLFLMAPEQDGTTPVEDFDDDGGDGVDAMIVRVLERSGTYRILATRLGDSFGTYQLTFQVEEQASSE